jgi:hypothetical protein
MKGELIEIDICRLFLQVISISDICDTDGIRITQQAYDGTFVQNRTNIHWPTQHHPSKGGWRTWRRFLRSFSDGNRCMFTPLEHEISLPSYIMTKNGIFQCLDP